MVLKDKPKVDFSIESLCIALYCIIFSVGLLHSFVAIMSRGQVWSMFLLSVAVYCKVIYGLARQGNLVATTQKVVDSPSISTSIPRLNNGYENNICLISRPEGR